MLLKITERNQMQMNKKIDNRKMGDDFEKEAALYFEKNNYWVYRFPNKICGQPFDILAINGSKIIAADCKVCSVGRFDKNRIESNQHTAMYTILRKTNAEAGFILKLENKAIFISYSDVISLKKRTLNTNDIMLKGVILFDTKNNDSRKDNVI